MRTGLIFILFWITLIVLPVVFARFLRVGVPPLLIIDIDLISVFALIFSCACPHALLILLVVLPSVRLGAFHAVAAVLAALRWAVGVEREIIPAFWAMLFFHHHPTTTALL